MWKNLVFPFEYYCFLIVFGRGRGNGCICEFVIFDGNLIY